MDGSPKVTPRPLSLLICAMGGEGGGVLTGWIVAAAEAEGLAVQATSVPGVAQRTGATTYYVEMAERGADGRAPVFALVPVAGEVDAVIASELLEAARAARLGYVTPQRTRLICSTHRVFLIQEKMAMGDGRLDPGALEQAATGRARQATTLDMDEIARDTGAPISAVMLGALAGAAALPISRQHFEGAIRKSGIAVERNLAAFAAAHARAAGMPAPAAALPRKLVAADFIVEPVLPAGDPSLAFPAGARSTIDLGRRRLADYQDDRYAALYLKRLEPFAGLDAELVREVARHLALRMSYEDVIRVASHKAAPQRFERIRDELGLTSDEPFEVQDFFKPGINELADVLPPALARPLLSLARRYPRFGAVHIGMKLKATTVSGYLRILLLARLKRWRRGTWRYSVEQRGIQRWLGLVLKAAQCGDIALALEVTALARLIKGYGDTHERGSANFERIAESLVEPALAAPDGRRGAAAIVGRAAEAALADPDGKALAAVIADAKAVVELGQKRPV